MYITLNLETVGTVHTHTHTSNIKNKVKHIFLNLKIGRLDMIESDYVGGKTILPAQC